MSSATEHSEFTLCSMNNAYLRACKKAKRALIFHKCIHKQLQSENTLEVVNRMLSDLMKALSGKSLRRKIKNLISEDLQSLLEKLGVDDIILIDGTEMMFPIPVSIILTVRVKADLMMTVHILDLVLSFILHSLS